MATLLTPTQKKALVGDALVAPWEISGVDSVVGYGPFAGFRLPGQPGASRGPLTGLAGLVIPERTLPYGISAVKDIWGNPWLIVPSDYYVTDSYASSGRVYSKGLTTDFDRVMARENRLGWLAPWGRAAPQVGDDGWAIWRRETEELGWASVSAPDTDGGRVEAADQAVKAVADFPRVYRYDRGGNFADPVPWQQWDPYMKNVIVPVPPIPGASLDLPALRCVGNMWTRVLLIEGVWVPKYQKISDWEIAGRALLEVIHAVGVAVLTVFGLGAVAGVVGGLTAPARLDPVIQGAGPRAGSDPLGAVGAATVTVEQARQVPQEQAGTGSSPLAATPPPVVVPESDNWLLLGLGLALLLALAAG